LVVGTHPLYITLLGLLGLGIEATLPIPQFLSNHRNKSVAGFRPSVILAWLLGDAFKISYFFFGRANVTWQFKACAVVQILFDLGIGGQFLVYGSTEVKAVEEEMEEGGKGRRDVKGVAWEN
jgi:solute carrier family 66, member 2